MSGKNRARPWFGVHRFGEDEWKTRPMLLFTRVVLVYLGRLRLVLEGYDITFTIV